MSGRFRDRRAPFAQLSECSENLPKDRYAVKDNIPIYVKIFPFF